MLGRWLVGSSTGKGGKQQKIVSIAQEREAITSPFVEHVTPSEPRPQEEEKDNNEMILSVSIQDGNSGERVVQRGLRWGEKALLGPLAEDSTIILTLSDGAVLFIPFPPLSTEKPEKNAPFPMSGEVAYDVDGFYGVRRAVLRWEASPNQKFMKKRTPIPFTNSDTWRALNCVAIPLLYLALCFYSLYELALFGDLTNPTCTSDKFSVMLLPLTLIVGLWIAARAILNAFALIVLPYFQASRNRKFDSYFMDQFDWEVIFVDITPLQKDGDMKRAPDGDDGEHKGKRKKRRHRRQHSESQYSTDDEDELTTGPKAVDEEKFILWHDVKDKQDRRERGAMSDTAAERRLSTEVPLIHTEEKLTITVDATAATDPVVEWPIPLPPVGFEAKEWSEKVHHSYWGGWSSPDFSVVKLRGKTYLTDNLKIPCGPALFHCVHVDLLGCAEKVCHIAAKPHSYIQRMRQSGRLGNKMHLIINFEMPGSPINHALVGYFVRSDEDAGPAQALIDRFMDDDDTYRNATLKLIPRIAEGNWFVVKALGQTPAIIGKKLTVSYYVNRELNYLEVDVDCGSSAVGARLQGLVQSYTTGLTIDVSWVLQGITEDELPERLLAGFRIIRGDLAKPKVIPTDAEEKSRKSSTAP